jgi:hypothetical protein
VIAPEIGQVTEAVASSPTPPLSGVHSEIKTENVYEGFVGLTAPLTGLTTQFTAVPSKG